MTSNYLTFEQIKLKAARLVDKKGMPTDLGRGVDNVLDRARINADDTIHVEKSAPESQYDSIAMDTIESCLACDEDALRGDYWNATPNQIRAWFRRHGVRC